MGFISVNTGDRVRLDRGYTSPAVVKNRPKVETRPSSRGGAAGAVSAVPASVSAAERAARTLEANARRGVSASNTAAAPAAPVSKATTSRGRVSLDPERGYSPGGERAARQYVSLPEPRKAETAPADYRRAVELNRLNRDLNRLEAQRRQATVDLDTDALNRVNRTMKDIRAATGKQTFGDRANDTISGSVQSYGASMVNTAGTAMDILGAVNTRNRNYTTAGAVQAARDNIDRYRAQLTAAKTAEERERLETLIRSNENRLKLMGEQTEFQAAQSREAAEQAHALADRMQDDSAASIARAKEGLGELGQLALDVGIAGGQMGLDALTAALTGGSALAPMAVRSFGDGAQEARLAGAGLDRQFLYGLGSAALSVGTERISNIAKPFQKMFGQGAAEKIAGSLAKRFGENGAVQLMQRLSRTAAGRIVLSAIGEGGEEVVEDLFQPFLKRAVYDPEAKFDAGEAWNDFTVGAILGGLGGGVEAVGNMGSKPAGNQAGIGRGAEAQAAAAPETARGGESVQSRPLDILEQEALRLYGKEKTAPGTGTVIGNRDSVHVVQKLKESIPALSTEQPVSTVSSETVQNIDAPTMAAKARKLFDEIKGFVSRQGFGIVEINNRSMKDDLSHGVGLAKASVIPAIPSVIQRGRQIDFQDNWKNRGYSGYTFAAPVILDGKPVYLAAVVKQTSKNRFYLHEVVDSNGNIMRMDSENQATPTSLAANGDAGAQSPLSGITIPQSVPEVKSDPLMQALFGDGKPAEPDRPLDVLEQEVQRLYGRRGAAAPEVKTDALTQILLDSIKPAERSRPLDVLEQEVQRLYGRRGAAAPEVKTDALTQILLDSIKPAERSRPLDVLEQEALRLYGRRDSATPQAGGGALTQALFGNGKDGPGAAEPDALPITAERDMLEIKKEGIAHGAEDRGRAESAGRFVERSRKALRGVRESGDVRFGFRRPVESGISGTVRSFREELTALGIPCEVTDGEVEWNRDGLTRTRWIEEAATYAGKLVFINYRTTIAPRNAAGHEAYHFWKDREARQTFSDILQDNLLFSSKVLLDYQSRITKKYFGGEVDLSNEKQLNKLMEELFAYIAGDIHEGTNEARLRGMLHDYDAVKAAWEALIRSAPEANPTGDDDPLMQEIRWLYGRRETAAPEVKTDALTQILLDSIKPAERSRPLDVMEQEVQRLYGRRDSAVPEVKTDALTQILLDSIKPAERSRPLDVMEQEVQRLYGRRGAAAPEVKTDALTQILLDSIKPAERSRPLDVLEQEALRLYGRRDSATPQAGGGALTQALFGNGKDGPGAAEPDALPITAERDMLEIKKEGIAHGAEDRGRAESAGRFVERSRKALCGVRESGDVVFGFRRSVESGISGSARAFQEELTALGVPCELMDGEVEWNRDGVTRTRWIEEAAAFAGKLVFINGETTIAPRNAAGHEAYHFWKNSEAREAFDEVLQDNLLFSSKDFLDYQNTITRKYFGGEVDLSSQKNLDKLMEELFAYIAGDIHEGTNEAYLRPMLHDYDAVKAAWEALIRFVPEANPTGDADPLMQEIRHLYGRRETAAPKVKTDALTQILLDSIKPAERSRPLDVLEQEALRLYRRREPAEPEIKTDALTQILLDSIKPAERSRPLDVLEQEVQRLYGRRGAAAPEVKTDALTQILLDSIKPAERSRPLDVLEQEVQRLYGRRDSAVDGGGLQETGGLPAAADIRELYAAAFQNRLAQPGIAQGWRAELEVPALYQEYLRRICGVQPAVPLLPERSGAGREGPADIEGGALVPMLPDTAVPEWSGAELGQGAAETGQSGAELKIPVENPLKSDIIGPKLKSGALDPRSGRAQDHAERYYQAVRKMTTDVRRIAENTGYPVAEIQKIKNFIFLDEHDLGDGKIAHFDASYEMAESWQRLIDGKAIQPHDLTLLRHEIMERELMEAGYTQDEAHTIVSRKFNYRAESDEYYGNLGKNKQNR